MEAKLTFVPAQTGRPYPPATRLSVPIGNKGSLEDGKREPDGWEAARSKVFPRSLN